MASTFKILTLLQLVTLVCCITTADNKEVEKTEEVKDDKSDTNENDLETQETFWAINPLQEKMRALEYLKNKLFLPFMGLKSPSYYGGGGVYPGFSYGGGANFLPSYSYGNRYPSTYYSGSTSFYPGSTQYATSGSPSYYYIRKSPYPRNIWYNKFSSGGAYQQTISNYAPDCNYPTTGSIPSTYTPTTSTNSQGTPLYYYYYSNPSPTYADPVSGTSTRPSSGSGPSSGQIVFPSSGTPQQTSVSEYPSISTNIRPSSPQYPFNIGQPSSSSSSSSSAAQSSPSSSGSTGFQQTVYAYPGSPTTPAPVPSNPASSQTFSSSYPGSVSSTPSSIPVVQQYFLLPSSGSATSSGQTKSVGTESNTPSPPKVKSEVTSSTPSPAYWSFLSGYLPLTPSTPAPPSWSSVTASFPSSPSQSSVSSAPSPPSWSSFTGSLPYSPQSPSSSSVISYFPSSPAPTQTGPTTPSPPSWSTFTGSFPSSNSFSNVGQQYFVIPSTPAPPVYSNKGQVIPSQEVVITPPPPTSKSQVISTIPNSQIYPSDPSQYSPLSSYAISYYPNVFFISNQQNPDKVPSTETGPAPSQSSADASAGTSSSTSYQSPSTTSNSQPTQQVSTLPSFAAFYTSSTVDQTRIPVVYSPSQSYSPSTFGSFYSSPVVPSAYPASLSLGSPQGSPISSATYNNYPSQLGYGSSSLTYPTVAPC